MASSDGYLKKLEQRNPKFAQDEARLSITVLEFKRHIHRAYDAGHDAGFVCAIDMGKAAGQEPDMFGLGDLFNNFRRETGI